MGDASDAYVALLHGSSQHFFLYALVLGHRLKKLDADISRVLLLGRPFPGTPAPFVEGTYMKCLSALWDVQVVDLVDGLEADKSPSKRHRFVFTKLRAFEVPFKRTLFIDLDTLVRKSLKPLFEVKAPAGLYHGLRCYRDMLQHGAPIDEKFLEGCCVNAGLMRVDPPKDTQSLLYDMLNDVAKLDYQTYLPEQYYLTQKFVGWTHISVAWNCEVHPCMYVNTRKILDPESSAESRHEHFLSWAEMPKDWWLLGTNQEELEKNVNMFHFSGRNLEPWWFLHHSATTSNADLIGQYLERDFRGMLALAVSEWLQAVDDLERDFAINHEELVGTIRKTIEELCKEAVRWASWFTTCSECGTRVDWSKLCEECFVRTYAHTLLEGDNDYWGRWVKPDSRMGTRSKSEEWEIVD